MNNEKVIVGLSGGLDSTILTYDLAKEYGSDNVIAVSFAYNQRHDIELCQAQRTTKKLGIQHKILPFTFLGEIVQDVSAMVKGDVETPTMKDIIGDPQPVTYVPNRNMIIASVLAAVAEANDASTIALGIQKIDAYAYWDTTLEFYQAVEQVLKLNRKFPIRFAAPFIDKTKKEEIQLGMELGVPFEDTWTCYNPTLKDNVYHTCNTCPSCKERAQAFKVLGIDDPVASNGVKSC
jgi:7-cyano-7-deazaguanine synthase